MLITIYSIFLVFPSLFSYNLPNFICMYILIFSKSITFFTIHYFFLKNTLEIKSKRLIHNVIFQILEKFQIFLRHVFGSKCLQQRKVKQVLIMRIFRGDDDSSDTATTTTTVATNNQASPTSTTPNTTIQQLQFITQHPDAVVGNYLT